MRTQSRNDYCAWLDAAARDAHDAINRIHVEAYADLVRAAELYKGELACRRPVRRSAPGLPGRGHRHRGAGLRSSATARVEGPRFADPRPGG
ncbi:hypothetical protein ATK30_5380 [Amycolatopsis echigonensis]|uniref:Uncharacterized protein n=1 Tax=Amycolatopsis echigonensis TaxID=2576905 RepID=A0A2N3WKU7_9PSEU|nr:hypothetical protein [Amycolatopsis niigatensis]PKV94501.1 hypothetical protein ATK30_5380 [Amycolatopsis niigatensis]